MSATDGTRPPRPGEELDADALGRAFAERLPDAVGEVSIEQFPAGHSNLTYLITIGRDEYVLRRPPFGYEAIASGHDMLREFRILAGLRGITLKAPRPYFYCPAAESPFGAPFYTMERVRGRVLRAPPLDGDPDMRAAGRALVATLAELHAIDVSHAGLTRFGKPEGYVARQVHGWTERYARARTDDVPAMERVAAWLHDHMPADAGAALVHNDFKFDNVVFDSAPGPPRVRAVLDWEMATVGDPLADLGTTLAYWIEPDDPDVLVGSALGLTAAPGNLTRAEVVAAYADSSGREVPSVRFHYVLGAFKVAVIAQQIYARFVAGHTQDPRFAAMRGAVRALAECSVREIEAPKLP